MRHIGLLENGKFLLSKLLIALLAVSPLAVGGLWIYSASAGAFEMQHDIRVAQNDRSRLVRIHLAKELDVLGFAATHDVNFSKQYDNDDRSFEIALETLKDDLLHLNPKYQAITTATEMQLYKDWEKHVALPILQQRNIPVSKILRVRDEQFSHELLAEDTKIQEYLNSLAFRSEVQRQALLRHILLSSIALVASAIALILLVLTMYERGERKRFTLNRQIEEEHRITEMLQRSLAPDILPHIEHIAMHVIYVPASLESLVGGDWYEAVELSQSRIMCIIGDVAGHGLDAAVVMNRARQSILAAATAEDDPGRILQKANRLLMQFHTLMVTAVCCILDLSTMQLTYASAGHPSPVIAGPKRGSVSLASGGPPLGLFTELSIESQSVNVEHGECIFLFTDGLMEETRDVLVGERRILDAACISYAARDPAKNLYQTVINDSKPKDDVAVLAIKIF